MLLNTEMLPKHHFGIGYRIARKKATWPWERKGCAVYESNHLENWYTTKITTLTSRRRRARRLENNRVNWDDKLEIIQRKAKTTTYMPTWINKYVGCIECLFHNIDIVSFHPSQDPPPFKWQFVLQIALRTTRAATVLSFHRSCRVSTNIG